MRVGTICFATDQGLGILAKDFYDNGIVTDAIVLAHGKREDHQEWYPKSPFITNLHSGQFKAAVENMVDEVDVMLFFETPFDWDVIDRCRSMGIKTVLMPMYECMPKDLPAQPDLFLNPSLLDQQYYPSGKFLPIPVDRLWIRRDRARVFVHNAGHGGLKGRNGTQELINAIPLVKSREIEFIIRCQDRNNIFTELQDDTRVFIKTGTQPYETLYDEGDVFLFPEKFNGLSLPLQEAYASGMLVMATDRHPMNKWLPNAPLIPNRGFTISNVSPRCNAFQEAIVTPEDIAATIDKWAGKFIGDFSLAGKEWASCHSWEVLKPQYLKVLEELL